MARLVLEFELRTQKIRMNLARPLIKSAIDLDFPQGQQVVDSPKM